MPKKIPRPAIMDIYQARQQGKTLDEILKIVEAKYGGKAPSRATITRHLKRFKDIPPEELAEDVPFEWGAMSQVPWASSRLMLDMWEFYLTSHWQAEVGPLTKRMAKWWWRVIQAMTAEDRQSVTSLKIRSAHVYPDADDALQAAQEYSLREIASLTIGEPLVTRDLDLFFAMRPWSSQEKFEAYKSVSKKHGVAITIGEGEPEHIVNWHRYQVEWLDNVDPERAKLVRETLDPILQEKGIADHSSATYELIGQNTPEWRKQFDGLWFSQQMNYLRYRTWRILEKLIAEGHEKESKQVINKALDEGTSFLDDLLQCGKDTELKTPWYIDYMDQMDRSIYEQMIGDDDEG